MNVTGGPSLYSCFRDIQVLHSICHIESSVTWNLPFIYLDILEFFHPIEKITHGRDDSGPAYRSHASPPGIASTAEFAFRADKGNDRM